MLDKKTGSSAKAEGNFEARSINAEHKDLIHDVAYDFYGERMATCSSDQHVKVWDLNDKGEWQLTANWKAHSGSVWKVTWAHPDFGQVIATCSFDRTAAVWEEIVDGAGPGGGGLRHWVRRTNLVDSRTSVTDVKFAPKQMGLMLASCSADGIIRVYEAPDMMNLSQWTLQHEVTNKLSCSCITWNCMSRQHPPMLAVGSDDPSRSSGGKVFIYEYSEAGRKWAKTETISAVVEPVHDIAFAPNLGRSFHMLAIASKEVRVFTIRESNGVGSSRSYEIEQAAQLEDHGCSVWRVGWNVTGTLLASSGDDGCVRLWRASYKSSWKCVGVLKGNGTPVTRESTSSSTPGTSSSRYLRLSLSKQFVS